MLRLTLAAGHYDRTEALRDGRVRAEGIDLTYIMPRVEEIFWRMAQHREFDASEFSLGGYVVRRGRGADDLVGVVGLVENMPDGNSYRPSDVLTSMSGKTIEVELEDGRPLGTRPQRRRARGGASGAAGAPWARTGRRARCAYQRLDVAAVHAVYHYSRGFTGASVTCRTIAREWDERRRDQHGD